MIAELLRACMEQLHAIHTVLFQRPSDNFTPQVETPWHLVSFWQKIGQQPAPEVHLAVADVELALGFPDSVDGLQFSMAQ